MGTNFETLEDGETYLNNQGRVVTVEPFGETDWFRGSDGFVYAANGLEAVRIKVSGRPLSDLITHIHPIQVHEAPKKKRMVTKWQFLFKRASSGHFVETAPWALTQLLTEHEAIQKFGPKIKKAKFTATEVEVEE